MGKAGELEGAYITAKDMEVPETDPSEIVNFFNGSTVFLTGATGFLGKLFLEKMLRTCNDLKRVYILVRPKKGKDVKTRFEELFDGPSFEPLKNKNPNFSSKVTLLSGDCELPDLGLDQEAKELILNEVNVIIHCAATVRFDQTLRTAAQINVRSVVDLVEIARKMKHLKAFLYVSTAYSNCIRKEIDEKVYEPPISGTKLLALLDSLDDDKLEEITPIMLGKYPNSYTFTKAVAESVIAAEAKNLPVAVFRPSIVIASVSEPVAGWIDNLYGATGIFVATGLGLLHSVHGHVKNKADLVPADYVINCGLAAIWDLATNKNTNNNKTKIENEVPSPVPVYNFVCSPEAKITWDTVMTIAEKRLAQVPFRLQVWAAFCVFRPSFLVHTIATLFYQTVPYIADFLALCIGKKPTLVKVYQKMKRFAEVTSYFTLREWTFHNDTVVSLWRKMGKDDRANFQFSMKNFDWDMYFGVYFRGIRVYLLKDPLDTIPQGKIKYYSLFVAHYTLAAIFYFLVYKLIMFIFRTYIMWPN